MLFSLQEFSSWISKYERPKRALFVSLVFATLTLSSAVLFAVQDGFGFINWKFFCLVGLTVFCSLARLWTTELTKSGNSEVGFSWLDLGAIPMMLATTFLSPLAGFLTAASSVAVMPLLKTRWRSIPVNFTTYALPYLVAGISFSFFVDPSASLLEKLFYFALAGTVAEGLSCILFFMPFLRENSELSFGIDYLTLISSSGALVVIATIFAGGVLLFGFTVPLIVLAACLAFTPVAELLVRFRLGIEGQRALSWGMAAAALKLVGDQDNRLRRHSINVARYMRDFAKEMKMSRGVQELAFMYGLLHDIGLAGLKRHIRIAEEEYLRDDAPPEPVAGEKTFQWEPLEQIEEDDATGQAINKGREAYEALAGGSTESMQEPAWWRSKDARKVLTDEDIDQLDCHELSGGLLLQSANAYGCLPELIANHHQPPAQNPKSTKEKLQHMLAICDRYESLSAIDGSFPAQKPVNAITLLETDAGERFDQQLFTVFTGMMQKQSTAYQNGTDIDYASQGHIEDFLDPLLPGAFNLAGWLKFGMTTPNTINAIATHKQRKV